MNCIIYPNDKGGVIVLMPTGELPIEEVAAKDVPTGVPYKIVPAQSVPSNRTFRDAWVMDSNGIAHDFDKCQAIGHAMRRKARNTEFEPYDSIIAKQIPGNDAALAESMRQKIRERYHAMQETIDNARTPEEIEIALNGKM